MAHRPGLGCKLRHPDAHHGMKASLRREQAALLPPEVDHQPVFDVITDQSNIGSCVPSAATGGCHQKMVMQGLGDWQPARLPPYRQALERDGAWPNDDGTFPETVLAILSEEGFAPEAIAPYAGNADAIRRKLTPEYIAAAAKARLTAFAALERDRETIMSELFAGHPVIFSMLLHESFQNVKSDGIVRVPGRRDAELGGHEMRGCGYTPEFVKMANTWGRAFGKNGYVFVPWSMVLDAYTTRAAHAIQAVQLIH